MMLSVYNDDFKMAGPKVTLNKAWTMIRSAVSMDEPTPLGEYVGRGHEKVNVVPQNCVYQSVDEPRMNVVLAAPNNEYPCGRRPCREGRGLEETPGAKADRDEMESFRAASARSMASWSIVLSATLSKETYSHRIGSMHRHHPFRIDASLREPRGAQHNHRQSA